MKRILLGFDSYKEAASNREIEEAITERCRAENVIFDQVLLADGGENSISSICDNLSTIEAIDPEFHKINAKYGYLNDAVVIEMAEISGLSLIQKPHRNPLKLSTYGLGIAVARALERESQVILTIGGSATIDFGVGFLQACGVMFLNARNEELKLITPEEFLNIDRIDVSQFRPTHRRIIILCDVQNHFLDAAPIYGPEKGATTQQIDFLLQCAEHYSCLLEKTLNKKISSQPGDGAAGGILFSLRQFFECEIHSGAQFILEEQNFKRKCQSADYFITGEGKLDESSNYGKACKISALMCKEHNPECKTIGIFGQIESTVNWLDAVFCCEQKITTLEDAMSQTVDNICATTSNIIALL